MRSYLALATAIIGLFLAGCDENETVRLEPPAPSPASTAPSTHGPHTIHPIGHQGT